MTNGTNPQLKSPLRSSFQAGKTLQQASVNDVRNAAYDSAMNGPSFGVGDLTLSNNMQSGTSSPNAYQAYQFDSKWLGELQMHPCSLSFASRSWLILAGAASFTLKQIEVFVKF